MSVWYPRPSGAWALNQAMMSASSLNVICCFHGSVEDPAPGVGPVENLRGVSRVDLVLGQSFQCPESAPEHLMAA